MKKVPALITLDVHQAEEVSNYISCALADLKTLGIKATFFIPIIVMEENKSTISKILNEGHQIGVHGLYHNSRTPFNGFPPERYDLLNRNDQRRFIEEASSRAKNLIGDNLKCFRSPCFGISGNTIQLLEEYGYLADFSVNSQRLDFLSANPFTFNHLLAPRLPYHPDLSNPFRKGNSKLWEIPLSSFIIPFAVMSLLTIGSNAMKFFFNLLLKESKATSKPIVYMCHPEEFSPTSTTYTLSFKELSFKDFLPLKGEGIRARQAFRMRDPAKIHEYNIKFLKHITSFKDISFVTANEYINGWLN